MKAEEPARDHQDDEADLKSFVQLNHRDEQLFKRFMGKVSLQDSEFQVASSRSSTQLTSFSFPTVVWSTSTLLGSRF